MATVFQNSTSNDTLTQKANLEEAKEMGFDFENLTFNVIVENNYVHSARKDISCPDAKESEKEPEVINFSTIYENWDTFCSDCTRHIETKEGSVHEVLMVLRNGLLIKTTLSDFSAKKSLNDYKLLTEYEAIRRIDLLLKIVNNLSNPESELKNFFQACLTSLDEYKNMAKKVYPKSKELEKYCVEIMFPPITFNIDNSLDVTSFTESLNTLKTNCVFSETKHLVNLLSKGYSDSKSDKNWLVQLIRLTSINVKNDLFVVTEALALYLAQVELITESLIISSEEEKLLQTEAYAETLDALLVKGVSLQEAFERSMLLIS